MITRPSKPLIERLRLWPMALAGAGLLSLGGCTTLVDNALTNAVITPEAEIKARAGAEVMGPHMIMTRQPPPEAGDREYARALADQLAVSTAKYRDVEVAKADGYESFPPEPSPELKEIHYISRQRSADEADEIDPSRPGALLYRRTPEGELKLVGAMFTAPPTATLEELNRRVPLSMTRWHLHTNICLPRPVWDAKAWKRTASEGKPLFGTESPIATRRACEAVGGRFAPTIFGWMAHAYVFGEEAANPWASMMGHGDGHHH